MLDMRTYQAFFDELGQIEKSAMLADVEKGAAFNPIRGASMLWNKGLGKGLQQVGHVFNVGMKNAPAGSSGVWSGIKNVLRTPTGQALGMGALAIPAAAGAIGYQQGQGSRRY